LTGLTSACAAGFLRIPRSSAAEPPPETTAVRLAKFPAICFAPQLVCEDLLRAEGFTDVRYVDIPIQRPTDALDRGQVDFVSNSAVNYVIDVDAGAAITIVSPVHGGCYELFAHGGIRAIGDLKGKIVGTTSDPPLMSMIAAWVGLDPKKDLTLVGDPAAKPLELFVQGKLDALLGFPPVPQELHARKVGHVILKTAVDRPWSQYFCCMLAGNREFVRSHPVATKRVIRAVLKAADLCASAPERAARLLVKGGFAERYDYALQTLNEVPYRAWRELDGEDTIRFYALRAYELGFVKSTPQKIIAEATDFRFLNELKRELKT
jgi:NitT/TauT family transport system substrate-binding protein